MNATRTKAEKRYLKIVLAEIDRRYTGVKRYQHNITDAFKRVKATILVTDFIIKSISWMMIDKKWFSCCTEILCPLHVSDTPYSAFIKVHESI